MRALASVQRIQKLEPIPGADRIEKAGILGWHCVVKKGEFQAGDLCVYFEIDSILPDLPEFEFLRERKFRIKTIKLKGVLSQGLAVPLSLLPHGGMYEEGADVTETLGVKKYEPEIPAFLAAEARGPFPAQVPKTDETRIQSNPEAVIGDFTGKDVYITLKLDGTSATYLKIGGDIHVCSRNLSLKEDDTSTYWRFYRTCHMDDIFKETGNVAIQGEICGPGIQKNPLMLKSPELFVFNVYDIDAKKYYDYAALKGFCESYGLTMVPLLERRVFDFKSAEELLEYAKGDYPSGKKREGVVIRTVTEQYSPALEGRASFKVINNDYLLEND
jgi:RNA ligase (TIGR02306 family)